MTIFKFALLRGIRSKDYALNALLPFVVIFVRPLWVGEDVRGYYWMALLLLFSASSVAKGITMDKLDGTVVRILTTPTNTLQYLSQNFIAYMIPMTVQIVAITITGKFLYDWSAAFAFYIGLCYIVFAMSSVTFMFAWCCLFKSKETSNMMFGLVVMFAGTLGGLMLPIDLLPVGVRHIGAILPAYWASNGIGELIEMGATQSYWLSLGAILLFTIAYLLFGGKRRII